MSRRTWMVLGALVLTLPALGAVAPGAIADIAAPVIVPAPDSTGIPDAPEQPACLPSPPATAFTWTTCLLPESGGTVDWPTGMGAQNIWPGPRSFVLPRPGLYARWLGELRTDVGFPLIWRDVGSGIPEALPSGPFQFTLAGKYAWECDSQTNCVGIIYQKLKGTIYVIGPRPIVSYKRVSADNTGKSITYGFDASGSFVTDYTAHAITQYAFDFEDDGTFDQVSPEPTAQATFGPGPHTVRLKVMDDTGRTAEYPIFFEIPYVTAPNPAYVGVPDTGPGTVNPTGVRFSAAKVSLRAPKTVRAVTVRRRGLTVTVTGLTKGDRIRARLLRGKRTLVALAATTATSSRKTVRLRTTRRGGKLLRSAPRRKRLVLDVSVEGTDGFQTTKRQAIRVR